METICSKIFFFMWMNLQRCIYHHQFTCYYQRVLGVISNHTEKVDNKNLLPETDPFLPINDNSVAYHLSLKKIYIWPTFCPCIPRFPGAPIGPSCPWTDNWIS